MIWHAEIDKWACMVLEERYPGVPNLGDIKKLDFYEGDMERPDILCAGYPCQPFSDAGQRRAFEDERNLWPYVANAIHALRPRLVLVENVRGHLVRGFPQVLGDLAVIGFDAEWCCLRASDVGAPHGRSRLFALAYPHGTRPQGPQPAQRRDVPAGSGEVAADADSAAAQLRRGPGELPGPSRENEGEGLQRERGGVAAGDGDAALADPDSLGHEGFPEVDGPEDDVDFESWDHLDGRGPGAWGDYGPAIERWEAITGRVAPDPLVEDRLNAKFVEWMMDLPEGFVTDVIPRRHALKVLGNGVVTSCAAAAIRLMLARLKKEDVSHETF